MIAAWALFRRLLPYLVAVAVVFGALFMAYRHGVTTERARKDVEIGTLRLQHTTTLSLIDQTNRKALNAALEAKAYAEEKSAADMAALDLKFTKEIQNEKANSQRDVAAVRAGTWRVRDKFSCPGTGTGGPGGVLPSPGTSTGMGDGAASGGLGAEDAATLIATADEGDGYATQLRACQAIVTRDRAAK